MEMSPPHHSRMRRHADIQRRVFITGCSNSTPVTDILISRNCQKCNDSHKRFPKFFQWRNSRNPHNVMDPFGRPDTQVLSLPEIYGSAPNNGNLDDYYYIVTFKTPNIAQEKYWN